MCAVLFSVAGEFAAGAQVPNPEGNVSGGLLLPEQAAFDVIHYDITLRIDPTERTIRGAVVVYARIVQPTNQFVLDLDSRLKVDEVASIAGSGSPVPTPLS